MAESAKFHPALTITNVKSLVSITLDNEQALYHSWAALFTNLTRVHDLYDHIVPPTEEPSRATYLAAKTADPAMWKCLDAAILKWIYGIISSDLLLAILRRDDTAEGAWKRLQALFQDNKASQATLLKEDFTSAIFEEHHIIDNYCNYLQSLADQLAAVDAPVSNGRLVLCLTGSLPEAYSGTVDFIQNQEPLPSFESCRSWLKMAERTIKARVARESGTRGGTAMVAATSNDSSSAPKRNNSNNKGHNNNKNKGQGKASGQQGGASSGQSSQWQPRPPAQSQWPQWQPN